MKRGTLEALTDTKPISDRLPILAKFIITGCIMAGGKYGPLDDSKTFCDFSEDGREIIMARQRNPDRSSVTATGPTNPEDGPMDKAWAGPPIDPENPKQNRDTLTTNTVPDTPQHDQAENAFAVCRQRMLSPAPGS